jgi:hypothetical protein
VAPPASARIVAASNALLRFRTLLRAKHGQFVVDAGELFELALKNRVRAILAFVSSRFYLCEE